MVIILITRCELKAPYIKNLLSFLRVDLGGILRIRAGCAWD